MMRALLATLSLCLQTPTPASAPVVRNSAPVPTAHPVVTDVLIEVAGVPKPPAAPRADAAVVELGRKLFAQRCQLCHGARGEGDGPGARGLKPAPQRFADALWQARVADDEIKAAVVGGGASVGKSPFMPAAPDLKNKRELDAVVAFVRSLRSSAGTASVTLMLADGSDVTASADADADGVARVSFPGVVPGNATAVAVVDAGGTPWCQASVLVAPAPLPMRVACTPAR